MHDSEIRQSRSVSVTRRPERFVADDSRVIPRYLAFGDPARIRSIIGRILAVDEADVPGLLEQTLADFSPRHRDIRSSFEENYREIARHIDDPASLSEPRRLLLGAYFTLEYSIESAALFNPSIVMHPDQQNVPSGSVRFLMSMRAVGEGHVSSIVFRRGVIDGDGHLEFDPPPRYAFSARPVPDRLYHKDLARRKLIEMGEYQEIIEGVFDRLGDHFSLRDLEAAVEYVRYLPDIPPQFERTAEILHWLCRANYALRFPNDCEPAEIVIFPATDNEAQGMEDLRLVRFVEDNGEAIYLGTYTAFSGSYITQMMLETRDFVNFHVVTLNGRYMKNKGMAIFPRRIDGRYAAISRYDGESLFLMISDDRHFWNEAEPLQVPVEPWELVQIGNCGPPIETEAGWLLLTHGVGPVRRYCIGAMLLDIDDPSKVIGRLRQPLIEPVGEERVGYVPNVVYSCGSLLHQDHLIIPYAMSDSATKFANVSREDLLARLLEDGP